MTQQQTTSKEDLLHALRSSGRTMVDRLRALPPEQFEQGRYENGWNGRQILAHVASIEWTYPRLLDLAREAPPPAADAPRPEVRRTEPAEVRRTEPAEAGAAPSRPMRGGIDDYNERQVAKRADASVEELFVEFERNRAATIAAVENADEALFARPIRSAGGITGALADVINAIAVLHVLGHAQDILGEPLAGQ